VIKRISGDIAQTKSQFNLRLAKVVTGVAKPSLKQDRELTACSV